MTKKDKNDKSINWINIANIEGIYLLKEIIDYKVSFTILILLDKDIIVRELFQKIHDKNIVEKLKKCIIVSGDLYNPKLFQKKKIS